MSSLTKMSSIAFCLYILHAGISATETYGQLADTPWPMFRHDAQHTGRSPFKGPQKLKKKWSINLGASAYSLPAIGIDGTIYVGTNMGKLYAVNPDGTFKWSFTTGLGILLSSSAIGIDGTIYVASLGGNLYALNPDGTLKWSYVFEAGIYSSPAIGAEGTIYMGAAFGRIHAINSDGTRKWVFTANDSLLRHASSPAIGKDGSYPAIDSDGKIYWGTDSGRLYTINSDGMLIDSVRISPPFLDPPIIGSDKTIYVITQLANQALHAIGDDSTVPVELASEIDSPSNYLLAQNYPNPFNPETEIRFQLPKASHVVIKVFNTLGEEIQTLVDGRYEAGFHSIRWNGRDKNGNRVSNGVYLYQLQADHFSQVKKMSLLR